MTVKFIKIHHVKCKKVSHCVAVKFEEEENQRQKTDCVWLSLCEMQKSVSHVTVFDFHHVKCKLSHCTHDCESHRVNVKLFSQPTRNLHPSVCNNKSWIWMICSILLSIIDAVYYYQWKLSPKVIIFSKYGHLEFLKWVLLASFPIGGPRFW